MSGFVTPTPLALVPVQPGPAGASAAPTGLGDAFAALLSGLFHQAAPDEPAGQPDPLHPSVPVPPQTQLPTPGNPNAPANGLPVPAAGGQVDQPQVQPAPASLSPLAVPVSPPAAVSPGTPAPSAPDKPDKADTGKERPRQKRDTGLPAPLTLSTPVLTATDQATPSPAAAFAIPQAPPPSRPETTAGTVDGMGAPAAKPIEPPVHDTPAVADGQPSPAQYIAPSGAAAQIHPARSIDVPEKPPLVSAAPVPSPRLDERLPLTLEPAQAAETAPAQPTEPGRAPPPAEQLAPALVQLMGQPDGSQTVTIRLNPAELGVVHISVNQTSDGAAHVGISAARPETLALLRADQPRLQQALDQAGVPAGGRSVTFQISPPAQIDTSLPRPASLTNGPGFGGQGGHGGGGWGGQSDRQPAGGDPGGGQQRPAPRWFRAGLDITA